MGEARYMFSGRLLATAGVAIFVATLLFHMWLEYARPAQSHEFVIIPLIAGAVLGWWGFFLMDPKRAKDGASVVVDAGERLKDVHFGRAGRRDTDPVVVTPDPKAPAHPDELPDKEKGQ